MTNKQSRVQITCFAAQPSARATFQFVSRGTLAHRRGQLTADSTAS